MNKSIVENLRRVSPQANLKLSCVEKLLVRHPYKESDKTRITPYKYKEEAASSRMHTAKQVKDGANASIPLKLHLPRPEIIAHQRPVDMSTNSYVVSAEVEAAQPSSLDIE